VIVGEGFWKKLSQVKHDVWQRSECEDCSFGGVRFPGLII
jgi:hypothetical protein